MSDKTERMHDAVEELADEYQNELEQMQEMFGVGEGDVVVRIDGRTDTVKFTAATDIDWEDYI